MSLSNLERLILAILSFGLDAQPIAALRLQPLLAPVGQVKLTVWLVIVQTHLHGVEKVGEFRVRPRVLLEVVLETFAKGRPAHQIDQLLDHR